MKVVGIDADVLILADSVGKGGEVSQPATELNHRARLLLLMHAQDTIVLPTVAIAEFLAPIPIRQHGSILADFAERFLCPIFDVRAASIAADLWAKQQQRDPGKTLYQDARVVLKADIKIIASAKAAGATVFYTNDNRCRELAKLIMDARPLPKNAPEDMFLLRDIESGEV